MAGVHGDGMRNLVGQFVGTTPYYGSSGGIVRLDADPIDPNKQNGETRAGAQYSIDASRTVPVANKFQGRAYGVNGCVWFGTAS